MTIKSVIIESNLGYGSVQDAYGGQQITITTNPELTSMLNWWREWGPVFSNPNPAVQASLQEIKTMHAISK